MSDDTNRISDPGRHSTSASELAPATAANPTNAGIDRSSTKSGRLGGLTRFGLFGWSVAFAGAVLLTACGQEFQLPPQPDAQDTAIANTYNLAKIWDISSPTAMASQGAWVYVIEEESRIVPYFTEQQRPIRPNFIADFQDLKQPVRIAIAQRESTYVYVADAGDMTVKRYHFTGGSPRAVFADSNWVEFSGLAADQFLNFYVSDATRDVVHKYNPDGTLDRLISDLGSGFGFVTQPNGLFFNGNFLLTADTGKNWVQRLRTDTTNVAAPGEPVGAGEFVLSSPEGVATDRGDLRNIYVADTGSDRIFKFDADGSFVDSVYTAAKIELDTPIDAPRHIAVSGVFVFVADTENNRIVGLELAGVPDTSGVGQP